MGKAERQHTFCLSVLFLIHRRRVSLGGGTLQESRYGGTGRRVGLGYMMVNSQRIDKELSYVFPVTEATKGF